MYWVGAIFALSFLIIVHEAGHYFVARWCGMRVTRFSVGFGPALLKRTSKSTGTIFQFAPVLFGGYAEIAGMNIAEEVDPTDKGSYANKPVLHRVATIFAGPATNFLSAFLLAYVLFLSYGLRSPEVHYGVGRLTDDAAARGKLELHDRIVAVDGTPMFIAHPKGASLDLASAVNRHQPPGGRGPAKPVVLSILRKGQPLDVTLTPKAPTPHDDPWAYVAYYRGLGQLYKLGIVFEYQQDRVTLSPLTAIGPALAYPFKQAAIITKGLYGIITGREKADVGGGVRIAEEFKKAFELGFDVVLELLMGLSVYLALFNLFPLPALDGGRLVFLIYELVTRRRANPRIEASVHMFGVMLLVVAMVLVTVKDCSRFF